MTCHCKQEEDGRQGDLHATSYSGSARDHPPRPAHEICISREISRKDPPTEGSDWLPPRRDPPPPSPVAALGTFPCRKMILSRADSLSTFFTRKPENGKRTGPEVPFPTLSSFFSLMGASVSPASDSRFRLAGCSSASAIVLGRRCAHAWTLEEGRGLRGLDYNSRYAPRRSLPSPRSAGLGCAFFRSLVTAVIPRAVGRECRKGTGDRPPVCKQEIAEISLQSTTKQSWKIYPLHGWSP